MDVSNSHSANGTINQTMKIKQTIDQPINPTIHQSKRLSNNRAMHQSSSSQRKQKFDDEDDHRRNHDHDDEDIEAFGCHLGASWGHLGTS